MADQKDLDFTYTTIDNIFRIAMGEIADYSGAMYNGDFSMTLREAQRKKHEFIADSLNIQEGSKVLDMGCGWGPVTHYVTKERGADCLGLTLSEGQAKACQKHGLNVLVKDCRFIKPEDFGRFDAVSSVGAFEHFCSVEEYKSGKQEEIYRNIFEHVSNLLPTGGRFYLQTMVFGKNMLDYKDFDINADKSSTPYMLALMEKEFPGSWLPYGSEMVIRNTEPMFKLKSISSGRLDYIETLNQFQRNMRKFQLKKYLLYLSLLPRTLYDDKFRHMLAVLRYSPNQVCFKREVMDHFRFVFEKL